PRLVGRTGGFIEQRVNPRIAVMTAIEADRRCLPRMKHTTKDVGICERAGRPLQRVELEIALQHIGKKSREFEDAYIEIDADVTKVLLNHGCLQPVEFERVRDLQIEAEPWLRSIAVRVPIACLVQQRSRARRIVREGIDVGCKGPRKRRNQTN